MKMKLAIAFAVLLFASAVHADTDFTITLNFTIPNRIQSSAVTEQFDATFNYDLTTGQFAPGIFIISSSGPLAPFTSAVSLAVSSTGCGEPGASTFSCDPDINWTNSAGDIINFQFNFDHDTPITVGPIAGQMFWECSSVVCQDNFNGNGNALYHGTVSELLVSSPEPTAWSMLLMGVLALALARVALRRASEDL